MSCTTATGLARTPRRLAPPRPTPSSAPSAAFRHRAGRDPWSRDPLDPPMSKIMVTTQSATPTPTAPVGFAGGRTKRALISWSAGSVFSVMSIILGLALTPLLLKYLGQERLGAMRGIEQLMGYLSLLDLGFTPALAVLLLRAIHAGDVPRVRAVIFAGMKFLATIASAMLVLGLGLGWFAPDLIGAEPWLRTEVRVAAMLSVVMTIFFPLTIFRSLLTSQQRIYLVQAGLILQLIIAKLLGVYLAWLGWGLIGVTVALIVGAVAYNVTTLRYALRGLDLRSGPRGPSPSPREMHSTSWPLAIAYFCDRINLFTDAIVVGLMLGTGPIAVLFLTQRLVAMAGGQINNLTHVSAAALAELRAKGQQETFAARISQMGGLIVGLGLVLTSTVAAYNQHFVPLWVGHENYGGDLISILTIFSTMTCGVVYGFAGFIDVQGDARHRLAVSVLGSALNLGLSVLFVWWIGLPGVVLGTTCGYLLTDAWYCPMLVSRRYGVPLRVITGEISRSILIGLPWAIGVWVVASSHVPPHGWLGLVLEGGVMGLLACVYCHQFLLSPPQRALVARIFDRLPRSLRRR